jgi:hypothetical protein
MHKVMEREGRLCESNHGHDQQFPPLPLHPISSLTAQYQEEEMKSNHHWTTHCENANIYIWHCIKIYIYLLVHVSA